MIMPTIGKLGQIRMSNEFTIFVLTVKSNFLGELDSHFREL